MLKPKILIGVICLVIISTQESFAAKSGVSHARSAAEDYRRSPPPQHSLYERVGWNLRLGASQHYLSAKDSTLDPRLRIKSGAKVVRNGLGMAAWGTAGIGTSGIFIFGVNGGHKLYKLAH